MPEVQYGGDTAYFVPNEQMILRYLNSISEKYERQYKSWLATGVVKSGDAYVIAINPRKLGHEHADTTPPRILQAAFAIGNQYITIDRDTLKAVGSGYEFRNSINKVSGTALFGLEVGSL